MKPIRIKCFTKEKECPDIKFEDYVNNFLRKNYHIVQKDIIEYSDKFVIVYHYEMEGWYAQNN